MHDSDEIHILGYFMDVDNEDFKELIKIQQQARVTQTHEIIALLNKKEGIHIKYEDIVNQVAQGGSIGRPHIAKAITNVGGTGSVMEAYAKYINDNSPVYVKRKTVTPHEAVEIIYDAGGIPVIAHPHDLENARELIKDLMNCGLRGIEAYHRKHSPAIVEYFSSMAEDFGLIVTGGSDFHAPNVMNGQIILGKNFVPEWIYGKLIEEKKRLDLA
jgi:predicted metal-dependent phosphoesterase TrpH